MGRDEREEMTSEQLREIEERFRYGANLISDHEILFSEIRRLRHIALECECNPLGVEPLCVYAKANMGPSLPVDAREGESHV